MARSERAWGQAHKQADDYLRRFGDAWTRSHRDDLVQEATIAAWRWSARPHDPHRFWAAVRTIAGRIRGRMRNNEKRALSANAVALARRGNGEAAAWVLQIAGSRVPLATAKRLLANALLRLPEIDNQLLTGFHEGFCCAELALRFGRSEQCIKTRIHRARRRVRMDIEESVRTADDLDVL